MAFEYELKTSGSGGDRGIDYRSELNEAQYAAVTAKPGAALVIAGAGSGKTRTLTYRVAYLVERGVKPWRILLLTFTNKASREMLRRVEELLPVDISAIWGGTFHHVGHRLLRRHGELLGLDKGFSILDREDSKDAIAACLNDAGINFKEKRFPKPEVLLDIFSMAVNTGVPFEEVVEAKYPYFLELKAEIEQMGEAYTERKLKANAVDYDDLLVMPLRLFRKHPEVLEKYQEQFEHVLVDEYQDTNHVQAELVDLLAGKYKQVMVVGDDAQSIYSWRGANFENIMTFPERYEGAEVFKIETNYRSVPEILELANEAISHNPRQYPKVLQSCREEGMKPAVIELAESRQQAMLVAQRILELHEQGEDLREMAVLYRSHFHSMEIQMELTKRNIPFQITSGIRFFEQAHIKDVASYLRFALNPRDELSFKRVARMLPGVGVKSAEKLWLSISSGAPWGAVKAPVKARAGWEQWGETHRQLQDGMTGVNPSELIQVVVDAVYDDYLKAKYSNYVSRLEDIGQLRAFAEQFADCEELLGQLSLLTNVDGEIQGSRDGEQEEDAVKLSTIHQAKGLEWNVVFVVMLCDGMFPSNRSLDSEDGEEEERRLFYVATTRAKNELYLVYPRLVRQGGYNENFYKPSRFLQDFPKELCDVWKVSESREREESWDDGVDGMGEDDPF